MHLSVVVPALNEERVLPATLAAATAGCPGAEILVCDGGSTDATVAVAERAGIDVMHAARGRGRQQNAGAAASGGDILLFLHADTALPAGAGDAIADALRDPRVVGGNFLVRYDPPAPLHAVFAHVNNWRARRLRHYYGDSCLFVRRSVFVDLGGFREGMLMEDWEFTQRLEARCARSGVRTVLLPLPVTTSARRFAGRRAWRFIALSLKLHYLHARGVSGDRLAAMYPDVR